MIRLPWLSGKEGWGFGLRHWRGSQEKITTSQDGTGRGEDHRPFAACKNARQRAVRTVCYALWEISELGLSTVLRVEEEGRR